LENLSSYAVSKAGMVRLTDSLAQEVKGSSIRVNAILPGAVDSPMQDQLLLAKDKAGPWYEKIKALRDSGSGGISADPTGELVEFLTSGLGSDWKADFRSLRPFQVMERRGRAADRKVGDVLPAPARSGNSHSAIQRPEAPRALIQAVGPRA
jgi:NAD(P)-dependent dehydrogenase (short-subunit alcohol dehydrogenase family)